MNDEMITTLDLFAGAGGLSLGFEQAGSGSRPVFAVELDAAAARTYKNHFGCPVYDGSIEDIEQFPEADVIIGGPPCQGFSPLGRDRDDVSRAQLNELWQHFLRAVRQVKPKAFVIENVPEFQRSAQFGRLLQLMEDDPSPERVTASPTAYSTPPTTEPRSCAAGASSSLSGRRDEVPWPPPATHGPESRPAVSHRAGRHRRPARRNRRVRRLLRP